MSLSNKQKSVIHVAKNQLGLDDEAYRDALFAYGGTRSSKDLNYKGFKAVMKHFENCGFKNSRGQGLGIRGLSHLDNRPGMANSKQIKKIYASWWALSGSYYKKGNEKKALRGFLKKRFQVEHEFFLTFEKAHQGIEAIKNISRRLKGEG